MSHEWNFTAAYLLVMVFSGVLILYALLKVIAMADDVREIRKRLKD